jgi:multidrug transporter EmrE-like cation transporter
MSRAGLLLVLAGVLLNAVAQFCLKAATGTTGPIALGPGQIVSGLTRVAMVPWSWIGVGCYAVSVLVWILALSRVPVTIAYPMLSLGYVLNAVAAHLWLGESLGMTRIVAIGVIIAGVFMLARSHGEVVSP